MSKQPIEFSLLKIEPLSNTLLHCVTPQVTISVVQTKLLSWHLKDPTWQCTVINNRTYTVNSVLD